MSQPLILPVSYKSITPHNAYCFRADLLEVVCNAKRPIIIDMSNVESIDQYGFGILFLIAQVVAPGKQMAVVLKPELIRELKESTGYRGILKVVHTIAEAREMIAAETSEHPSEDSICVSS